MDKSTLISVGASLGVVGTAVATAFAVPKAQRILNEEEAKKGESLTTKEKIVATADCYIPPILLGTGTIVCILGANVLNKKRQASLISSYAVLEQCYRNYRSTLVKLHGPAADEEVLKNMTPVRTNYMYHQTCIADPDCMLRWYEPISDQWFEAYEREVIDAEYFFNRNYALGCEISVNELLYFLNLPDMGERGSELVWVMDEGCMWIDFEHEEAEDEKGTYYILNCVNGPEDSTTEEWQECYGEG